MSLLTSILTGGINNHETTSEEANGVVTDFVSEGIVGDLSNTAGVAPATGGFAVNATGTPDTNVQITAGVAYVNGTPSSQNNQTFRVKNTATATLAISANSSGSTKYDWVYIRLNATNLNAPNTAGDNVADLVASRSSSSSADDGTPPTYGYPIAVVTVANGFSSITNANIRDIRVESGLTPTPVSVSSESWTSAGATPSSIVYNGNRSYSLTWPLSIITDRSVGMRNKYTRSVTAPTQCADLESSSSQYFNKTTPTGVTFTDDFTCSAWIKLESYTGANQTILSRFTTTGWIFRIDSSGRVDLAAVGGGTADAYTSYQSIPLNKWVHVAATLDMSGTTGTVYIDGVLVPGFYTNGTSTNITQAGNLTVGAYAAGSDPFDGKIAQAAVFSSVLSAATIRSYMSQTLTGAESTNVSAFSLNNTLNDLNANANNLTASGGALATNADSPFAGGDTLYQTDGTTEYSITTQISSDGLTETVQVPEGYAIPTSGGVSAVSYSTQKTPYGMPADAGKWQVVSILGATLSVSASLTVNVWAASNLQLTVPIGAWNVGWAGVIQFGASTNIGNANNLLAPATPTNGIHNQELNAFSFSGVTTGNILETPSRESAVSLAAATTYIMYSAFSAGTGTISAQLRGDLALFVIKAELNLV